MIKKFQVGKEWVKIPHEKGRIVFTLDKGKSIQLSSGSGDTSLMVSGTYDVSMKEKGNIYIKSASSSTVSVTINDEVFQYVQ